MWCRAAAWASAAKSGGPAGGGGQRQSPGGLADFGGELLEAGRGVQGEEPRGGGGDDVGVAQPPGQHRDGARACGVFL